MSKLLDHLRGSNKKDKHKKNAEELKWIDFDDDDIDEDLEDDEYEDEDDNVEEEDTEIVDIEEDIDETEYADDEDDMDEDEYTDDEDDIDEDEYTDDDIDEDEYADDEDDMDEDDMDEDDMDEDEYTDDEDDIDIDDEYVDDEDDIDEEDDDEDYEDDEDDEPTGIAAIVTKIKNLSLVDHIVMITGAAVLVLAVVTGSLYTAAKLASKKVATFSEIGVDAENIAVIGESGLLAIADAQAAKQVAAEIEEETTESEETNGAIEVALITSSIQKDLKLKFTNAETGKLISNVSFEVEIKDPSGKTFSWKDDDRDGIIYKKDIASGKYSVTMVALDNESNYKISTATITVTVKDTIEYKKVDIADEVKTEAQVNVAVEDTAVNQTTVESTNTDTVEWVESTKTLIDGTEKTEEGYQVIKKDTISDPNKTASAAMLLFGSGIQMYSAADGISGQTEGAADPTSTPAGEVVETPTPEPEKTVEPTKEPEKTAEPTKEPEKTAEPTLTPTAKPTDAPAATPTTAPTATKAPTTAPTATPKASASPTASAAVSASPSATPKVSATPSATPKATANPSTELKDNSGNRVYYKDSNGNYVAATYGDYSKYSEFYIKTSKTTGEYTYTGWQTLDGKTYFFDKNGNKVTGDQVIQGAKYSFNSDGSLNTGSGHMGIDVSKWNGNIDWNAVKNSGVSYVIIRCGYRGSTTGALIEDPTFKKNISGATSAGLKVGVYFFTQATNEVEAVEEASMAIALIKGYKISYPVFLDVEAANGRADGIGSDMRTKVCKAFCQTIQNSGYTAGIYANKTWFTSYMNVGSLTSYKLWLAQYAAAPTYTASKYDLWQYSSKGSVSGISGNVDMNISYLGY